MSHATFENKSLVTIALTGYVLNLLLGFIGFLFPEISYGQLLFFQMADSSAIMASVIAARYTGLRGQQVAASAFILLGITHGISLASSGLDSFNVEKGITVIMPMIPSFVLLCWCTLFPVWLRVAAFVPLCLFVFVYCSVISGGPYFSRPLRITYLLWMLLEITWAIYLCMDWKREQEKPGNA